MFLWPWRKNKLAWGRGIGGVRYTADFRYRVEPGSFGWHCEFYPDVGGPSGFGGYRFASQAMRACEEYEARK